MIALYFLPKLPVHSLENLKIFVAYPAQKLRPSVMHQRFLALLLQSVLIKEPERFPAPTNSMTTPPIC